MAQIIEADKVHRAVKEGRALLVCAYDDDDRCRQFRLSDALSLAEFEAQAPTLPKNRQIVFYCA